MGAERFVSLQEASRFWWRLGWVSFGGPAGQIALLHRELVEQRRWLSERRYLHALNFCMLLPGPEATQLATYLGWLMHGWPGGVVAGVLFLLPSALLLSLLAWLYALWGAMPWMAALFAALKPAVLAIVIVAAWRLGRRTLRTPLHGVLAVALLLLLSSTAVPYPVLVLGAALVGWLVLRLRPAWLLPVGAPAAVAKAEGDGDQAEAIHGDHTPTPTHARLSRTVFLSTLLVWGLAVVLPLAGLGLAGAWHGVLSQMARFFSQVALVTFGGAYAVLAYMAQDVVVQFGWLTAGEMVDALGLAETTPGPLILVTQFVGFLAGFKDGGLPLGLAGAVVALWVTFAPCFLWIFTGAPYIEWISNQPRLRGALTSITAAVVGVILNLSIWFALHVLFAKVDRLTLGPLTLWRPELASVDWLAVGLFLFSFGLAFGLRWGIFRILVASALLGAALKFLI